MHFASWLCGSGEQQYWDWMRYRERKEEGLITAIDFDYFKLNRGYFGTKIQTILGRITDTEEE